MKYRLQIFDCSNENPKEAIQCIGADLLDCVDQIAEVFNYPHEPKFIFEKVLDNESPLLYSMNEEISELEIVQTLKDHPRLQKLVRQY